ncbi:MAG: methyltransferase domain-containing protein [Brevundimonas sp.]|nr:MAG: methyltransferase domain-containing protein [Brevundimonas sp.]
MKCRHCGAALQPFIDLGSAPPSNAYLTVEKLDWPEKWFPLRVGVCSTCWLVQTEDFADAADLFDSDYAYFSSTSKSWLAHAEQYVETMADRFGLNSQSHVVEVASNDGYLLRFVKEKGIPCLGVEPTKSTAEAARAIGLDVDEGFFGREFAAGLVARGKSADLTAANNVLAHVPDINDFVSGFSVLLKPDGVSTFEFPHLMRLVAERQFDTVYHEHFSYLSLTAVCRIFETNGLSVFDVEEHSTHGGSLRVFAQRADTGGRPVSPRVEEMLAREAAAGMTSLAYYEGFQTSVNAVKDGFLGFLLRARLEGKSVVAYGAAAKGNTLMNYAGIRPDMIRFVVDRAPSKQGKFMPGSRIPIVEEQSLKDTRPDYVVILPWNLREEVMTQLDYIREWGGRFVTAVPELEITT